MSADIRTLYEAIIADPKRDELGFGAQLATANKSLEAASDDEATSILRKWLAREQPCLFGRVAAKRDLLSFCFIREDDLGKGDSFLRDKIQDARLAWTRDGYKGRKSGFVVVALSAKLVGCRPDEALRAFAARFASLYLLDDIEVDRVYLDEIYLERTHSNSTLKWLAGVNFFAAAADGRWWHDHRLPGGVAFSVNSVGHMVASSKLAEAELMLDKLFDDPGDEFAQQAVDSLEKALEFAMRTIDNAADTVSGKATFLVPEHGAGRCPVVLPPNLAGKNCREYAGYYHTDYTLPALYFHPDVQRPTPNSAKFDLDFTYLFDGSVNNPAHKTMGEGRKVRGDLRSEKRALAHPRSVAIDGETRLAIALRREDGG